MAARHRLRREDRRRPDLPRGRPRRDARRRAPARGPRSSTGSAARPGTRSRRTCARRPVEEVVAEGFGSVTHLGANQTARGQRSERGRALARGRLAPVRTERASATPLAPGTSWPIAFAVWLGSEENRGGTQAHRQLADARPRGRGMTTARWSRRASAPRSGGSSPSASRRRPTETRRRGRGARRGAVAGDRQRRPSSPTCSPRCARRRPTSSAPSTSPSSVAGCASPPYEGSYEVDPFRQGRQMADVAGFYRAFGAEAARARRPSAPTTPGASSSSSRSSSSGGWPQSEAGEDVEAALVDEIEDAFLARPRRTLAPDVLRRRPARGRLRLRVRGSCRGGRARPGRRARAPRARAGAHCHGATPSSPSSATRSTAARLTNPCAKPAPASGPRAARKTPEGARCAGAGWSHPPRLP